MLEGRCDSYLLARVDQNTSTHVWGCEKPIVQQTSEPGNSKGHPVTIGLLLKTTTGKQPVLVFLWTLQKSRGFAQLSPRLVHHHRAVGVTRLARARSCSLGTFSRKNENPTAGHWVHGQYPEHGTWNLTQRWTAFLNSGVHLSGQDGFVFLTLFLIHVPGKRRMGSAGLKEDPKNSWAKMQTKTHGDGTSFAGCLEP